MAFRIRMGIPEMEAFWNDMVARQRQGTLPKSEARFFKKLVKTLTYLQDNPRHNSLSSNSDFVAHNDWQDSHGHDGIGVVQGWCEADISLRM